MSKRELGQQYTSRKDRLNQHYKGWKMGIMLLLLAILIWLILNLEDVIAYLKTYTY